MISKTLVFILFFGGSVFAQTTTAPTDQNGNKAVAAKKSKKTVSKSGNKKQSARSVSQQQAAAQSDTNIQTSSAIQTGETAPVIPAEGTSVAATTTTAPAKKVTGSLVIGAAAMVNDLKENGSNALIDTANTLSVMYPVTDKVKAGVGHNFAVRIIGDRSQLADFNSDNGENSVYKTLDPTLHLNYKMAPLFGSNDYAILSRYYVPVSEDSRAKKSYGTLRTQAYITWSMNPKVDISFFGQARLYLNSTNNSDTKLGSDSVLRTIVGPIFGYNFNDVWNVYYNPYLDMRSSGYQRGKFDADIANGFSQDIGLWITLGGGKYIINPAWSTSASKLGKSTYEGAGDDANSEYDLNLIATF